MTPAEFDRPCSARRQIFEAPQACPPAAKSEYEVFNDIIRYLAIKIRNFPFSRWSSGPAARTGPHDVALVRPRKKTNLILRCKYRLGK